MKIRKKLIKLGGKHASFAVVLPKEWVEYNKCKEVVLDVNDHVITIVPIKEGEEDDSQ